MPAPTTTRSLFTGELRTLTTLPSAGAPPPHSRPLLRDGRGSAAGSWSSRPAVTQRLATPEPGQRPPRSCPTRHVKHLQTRDLDRPAAGAPAVATPWRSPTAENPLPERSQQARPSGFEPETFGSVE